MAKKQTNVGRPTKLTDEVRKKMEEVAALDGTIEEMAYYCDVARQTIYDWLKNDKEFSDKIDRLRERPILAARQTVVKEAKANYSNAMDYLSRKRKNEFSTRSELAGKDGEPVNTFDDDQLTKVLINAADKLYKRRNKSSNTGSKRKSD